MHKQSQQTQELFSNLVKLAKDPNMEEIAKQKTLLKTFTGLRELIDTSSQTNNRISPHLSSVVDAKAKLSTQTHFASTLAKAPRQIKVIDAKLLNTHLRQRKLPKKTHGNLLAASLFDKALLADINAIPGNITTPPYKVPNPSLKKKFEIEASPKRKLQCNKKRMSSVQNCRTKASLLINNEDNVKRELKPVLAVARCMSSPGSPKKVVKASFPEVNRAESKKRVTLADIWNAVSVLKRMPKGKRTRSMLKLVEDIKNFRRGKVGKILLPLVQFEKKVYENTMPWVSSEDKRDKIMKCEGEIIGSLQIKGTNKAITPISFDLRKERTKSMA